MDIESFNKLVLQRAETVAEIQGLCRKIEQLLIQISELLHNYQLQQQQDMDRLHQCSCNCCSCESEKFINLDSE